MATAPIKAMCGRLFAFAFTALCGAQGFDAAAVEPHAPQWLLLPPAAESAPPDETAKFLNELLETQEAPTTQSPTSEAEIAASAVQFSALTEPQIIDTASPAADQAETENGQVETENSQDETENSQDETENSQDETESIESQFEAFEKTLASLEESLEAVAEKADNKSIVVSGSSKSTMKVVGRVHADAWGFDTEEAANFNGGDPLNRLGFRRLRFGVRGEVKDNMEYRIEMEFAGGINSEFRDAWLGWNDLPWFQTILLGNQKRPYGLDHLNSSRFNVFLERPFVIEGFNQDARRLGVQSYGFSNDLRWNWRYGVFNQQNIQATGSYLGDNLQLQIAGRLANTFWYDDISGGRGYAHWAISGTHADSSDFPANEARYRTRPEARTVARYLDTGRIAGADHYELIGLEGVVNVGAVQVVGEYQSLWQDRNGFANTRFDGGYVYASYFLTGEHIPWSRESGTIGRIVPFQNFWFVNRCNGCREAGWGAWQVAVRYSAADFSDEDVLGGEGRAWTFGLNWYWSPNARVQLNYLVGDIRNRFDPDDNDDPVGIDGPENGNYNIWGTRFMIDF